MTKRKESVTEESSPDTEVKRTLLRLRLRRRVEVEMTKRKESVTEESSPDTEVKRTLLRLRLGDKSRDIHRNGSDTSPFVDDLYDQSDDDISLANLTETPEPPDYNHKKRVKEAKAPQLQNQKISLKYSDEEKIDELVDSVSVVLDKKEKQVTDHEYKHAEAKLADYYSLSNEYQDDSAILIKSSNDLELSVERIWEPGGLPTEAAQWYWTEKFSSHCEAFLCPQMQMLTWDPGSFKMLGRETGNNTHWLEDKREAQHKQNEVMKLTSSWHNCLWEPGGSPAEVAHWNWIVSCHEHAVTLELILKLHEPHLQRNTKGEVLELSCSQKFGVEKDVEATVGKWPEKRHSLLFYATLPVLITGNRYSIKSLRVTLSRLLDQILCNTAGFDNWK
ncbi:hypothetical protein F2Q69_00012891 [Brassica cretica]|uniref:Uncharacterized protein n=1 Tax=Brassica cretica TaxID=69181 RepID=A0A8S9QX24_BRACR|nr:hypothetical protein F2Q69_00012891 [Brassica cretica]